MLNLFQHLTFLDSDLRQNEGEILTFVRMRSKI